VSNRSSVLGFTEAELGFFLALLCLVLWVGTAKPPQPPPPSKTQVPTISPDSAAALQARLAKLQHLVDSLKSPILPTCRSKGVIAGPLLSVIALPGDNYRLNGETVPFEDVATSTAEARANAKAAGCVHEIRLGFLETMSAPDYEASRRRIGSLGVRLLPGPMVSQ
jgi:hypothetical protein